MFLFPKFGDNVSYFYAEGYMSSRKDFMGSREKNCALSGIKFCLKGRNKLNILETFF